ncbi:hypothetical protein AK830_g9847 [Neonectria ditissima]|uniref:AAA+ ATPase domain-containing protein n=1 Tax=Neonectria ditissima TaxID=78410 RepID=A0A0P7AH17_9HYPO|nr:hypothetical protein AK830_g9847 [Neonectria ditissima]
MSPDAEESAHDEPPAASWAETTASLDGHLSFDTPNHSGNPDVDTSPTFPSEAAPATTKPVDMASQASTYTMQLVHVPRIQATLQQKRRLLSQRFTSSTSPSNIPLYPGPGPDSLTQYGLPDPSGVIYLDGNWVELSSPIQSMPPQQGSGGWYFGAAPVPPYIQYVPAQQYPPPMGQNQLSRGMPPPPTWGFGNPPRQSAIPPSRMPPGPPRMGPPKAAKVINVVVPRDESESEEEPPPQHNPFDDSKSDDGASDSDSSDTSSSTSSSTNRKTTHWPDIRLLPKSNDAPYDSKDASPAATEWERQKRELGDKNAALDQLMSMVGIEEVKAEFLKVKATVEAARSRKGRLRRQGLNMALMGNPGTGKRTLAALYHAFLSECGVWPDTTHGRVHYELRSGSKLDPEDLDGDLGRFKNGVFLFIDSVENLDKKHRSALLSVLDWHADRLVVVLAGSPEGLTELLGSRPHGRWEFWRKLALNDYSDEQLHTILLRLIHHNSFEIADGVDSRWPLIAAKRVGQSRGSEGFGNVYDLVVAFEKMLDRHSARVDKVREPKPQKDDKAKKAATADSQDEDKESVAEEAEKEKVSEAGDATPKQGQKVVENKEVREADLHGGKGHDDVAKTPLLATEEPQQVRAADTHDGGSQSVTPEPPTLNVKGQKTRDENQDESIESPLLTVGERKEFIEAAEGEDIQKQTKEATPITKRSTESSEEKSKRNGNQDDHPKSPLIVDGNPTQHKEEDVQNDGNNRSADILPALHGSSKDDKDDKDDNNDEDVQNIKDNMDEKEDLEGQKLEEEESEDKTAQDKPVERPVLTMEDILGPEPTDVRLHSAAWKELDGMAGLEDIKKTIGDLMDRARVNYHRELAGKERLHTSLNRVFLGPPGTGKSTVAKLYGQILADIGLVSINNVVVTTPGDFISEYIGETEVKTVAILNATIGQVLIIDDAHTFYQGTDRKSSHDTDDYRLGCLDMIVSKVHNRPGDNRCVILAGYADVMEEMFRHVNPGLRRRFPLESAFRFKDYDDVQLNQILRQRMAEEDITAKQPAMDVAAEVLRRMRDRPNFGNGGDVQNLLDLAKARFLKRTSEKDGRLNDRDEMSNDKVAEMSAEDELSGVIVLEQQDFDPEWNRGANASTRCSSLFEGLIGFETITDELQDYQRIAANMRRHGKDPRRRIPFTFVFRGPPGTGKTHTARIIGQIFYDMGFLSTNEVVECSASQLIAEWMGQTAPMVVNLLERSLGKVLFIDEAYRLSSKGVRSSGGRSYEDEAVGELVDCMTKPRYFNKLIIVLAGYDQGMDALMRSNPGLRGRFPTDIMFRPMTPVQCKQHLINLIHEDGIFIRDGPDVSEEDGKEVLLLFHKLGLTPDWASARDVKTAAGIVVAEVYRRDPEDLKVEEDAPADAGHKFSIPIFQITSISGLSSIYSSIERYFHTRGIAGPVLTGAASPQSAPRVPSV